MMNSIHVHLIPLVFAVSLVYAATRHERWSLIWPRTGYWVIYILSFLGLAFFALLGLDYAQGDWWKFALGIAAASFLYKRWRAAVARPAMEKE
jgi:hypothetical protein